MEKELCEFEENYDNQLAENDEVLYDANEKEYPNKRKLLENTKISKQTWSILEIYQKIANDKLDLDPNYQRRDVWTSEKQTAFIESLFMGIVVPPIYVVENLGDDFLDEINYEVVDGRQRLTTIKKFIRNELKLDKKKLEYFSDWYGGLYFEEIKKRYNENVKEFLSQVLDVYVITANSPEFTKYDIFARLNKGAVQLSVNEIRRAVYRSELLEQIEEYVKEKQGLEEYNLIFSKKEINRYEDYGMFYRAVAFYLNTDVEKKLVKDYNSRPREMINDILDKYHKNLGDKQLTKDILNKILDKTIYLLKCFEGEKYYLDACIKCAVDFEDDFNEDMIEVIMKDKEIKETFLKSPGTTSNVNNRVKRVIELTKCKETKHEM